MQVGGSGTQGTRQGTTFHFWEIHFAARQFIINFVANFRSNEESEPTYNTTDKASDSARRYPGHDEDRNSVHESYHLTRATYGA